MRGDKDIDTHVELLMPDQQRIVDVSLHDICLRLVASVRPLRDLAYGSEQKNALALAAADLNDPSLTGFMIHTTF